MAGKTDDDMINTFTTFVCDKLYLKKTYSLLTSKDNVACFDEDSLYFLFHILYQEYQQWNTLSEKYNVNCNCVKKKKSRQSTSPCL